MAIFDFFHPNFLLHNAFVGCLAVGFFCPLIGVYFMLRRLVLLGVALPQISAAGISFAFFLEGLGISWTLHAGESHDRFLALAGSLFFTFAAIMILAAFEQRGSKTSESRLGAYFAGAYALSILLVSANPQGQTEVLNRLHGEIVAVSAQDLHLLLMVFGFLGVLLLAFNAQFLLVSFDREFAQVMGKRVLAWDALLYLIIGVALSVSVLIVGPMLTFAFLIVPPLAARRFSRKMSGFFALSSLFGGISSLAGFYASYHWDWPLGPTAILAASTLLALSFLIKKTLLNS